MRAFAILILLLPQVAAEAKETTRIQATRRYNLGVQHYKAGEYADAVTEFEAAYEQLPKPEWLFNLASACRMANQPQKALDYYKKYLAEMPDAPNKTQVEQRIAEMEKQLAPPPPPPEPEKKAPPPQIVAPEKPPAEAMHDENTPKTPYELGVRARYLYVTSMMLAPYLQAETQMLKAFSVGAEFVWHRKTYDVVTSLDFSWLNVDDGNYLGNGHDAGIDTQYTQFRNLSFISADVSVIGHYDVNDWFQIRGGAGLGIGAVLGQVLLTHNTGCTPANKSNTTVCYPNVTGPINGYPTATQEAALAASANGQPDVAGDGHRHVSKDVPPAMAVLNIMVAARFNLPKKFTLDVEMGFRDAMFVGVGGHYKF
jgi:tetratricopeptide (TPR) repeat protein